MATSPPSPSGRATGTTTPPTRWWKGCCADGLARRGGRLQRRPLLVPLALCAAPVSLVPVVHHRHVRGRPLHRPHAGRAPPGDAPLDRFRAGLLRGVRGARRLVQRGRPAAL